MNQRASPPCARSSRHALDRRLNSVIGHAAAQRAFHPLADLGVRRVRIPVEQRFRGHDLAVLAIAALRHLLIDPGLLQRIELAVVRKTFERGDLAAYLRSGQ